MYRKTPISSINNPQIKHIISLQTKTKFRNKQGSFVIEGEKLFQEAMEDGIIEKVYISESFADNSNNLIDFKYNKFIYEIIKDKIYKDISDTVTPQGILAIVKQPEYTIDSILDNANNDKLSILLLEDIRDPGNLGTIIRTAEGAGISGIIMNKSCVDLFNPKVIRSTMGSIFRVPIIITNDLEETVLVLKKNRVHIYATRLEAKDYYGEINNYDRAGIIIGNESKGISESLSSVADSWIRIPMAGKVESLNAAIASALIMYERGK